MLTSDYVLIHVSKFLGLSDIISLGSVKKEAVSVLPRMLQQITIFTIRRHEITPILIKACPRISTLEINCDLLQEEYDILGSLPIEKLIDNIHGRFAISWRRIVVVVLPLLKSASVYGKWHFDFSGCPLLTKITDMSVIEYRNVAITSDANILIGGRFNKLAIEDNMVLKH
jgi:hypothetical protein